MLLRFQKRIEALDYNPESQMIFWTDSYDKTIKRSYMVNAMNGDAKVGYAQDLNMKGGTKPTALAVDWVADNLYWAETDRTGSKPRGRIMVAKTDGRYRRALVQAGLEVPTAIAVDPQLGRMFWADAGSAPKIEVSWMDGSKRRPIITEAIRHPAGLTVDYSQDHAVYWVDTKLNTIEVMKPDGTMRRTVLKGDLLKHPVSLDVFESSLYWVTRDTGELLRQDKFGRGVQVTVQRNLANPSSIKGKQWGAMRSITKSLTLIARRRLICLPHHRVVPLPGPVQLPLHPEVAVLRRQGRLPRQERRAAGELPPVQPGNRLQVQQQPLHSKVRVCVCPFHFGGFCNFK